MKPTCVQPITLSGMVGFENNSAKKIIMTRDDMLQTRTMSLDQRSRSQSALKLCV